MRAVSEQPRRAIAAAVGVLLAVVVVFALGGVAQGGGEPSIPAARERELVTQGAAAQARAQKAERRVVELEKANDDLADELRDQKKATKKAVAASRKSTRRLRR